MSNRLPVSRACLVSTVCCLTLAACAVSPRPFASSVIAEKAKDHLGKYASYQEPINGPISLYEAMARALKYNLDHRVEAMQAALRSRELNLANFNMLPNVVASSGYAVRNNENASRSVNVLTGQESLAVSTSQEKEILTADVTFSWNILDFGLSYVRAKQAADKHLVAKEMRRKTVHRIIENVRTAFWRAVSAERLAARLSKLERRVRSAQRKSRKISNDRQTSPITAATYERELVEIKRKVQEMQAELAIARTQLSSLMNLKPGTPFKLARVHQKRTLRINTSAKDMIWAAMNNRAELRDVWYRRRINDQEIDAALLELLPGLTPYAGTNFSSNDFLFNSNWLSWGAKASWNLIRLFQYPAKKSVIEGQDELLEARGLAITMAVVTQVHVSRVRFHHSRRQHLTSNEYLRAQARLTRLLRSAKRAGRISEQTLIREELNLLVAEARRDIAYAKLQNAYANVYASMGLDPVPAAVDLRLDLKSLASSIAEVWLERGDKAAGVWVTKMARS